MTGSPRSPGRASPPPDPSHLTGSVVRYRSLVVAEALCQYLDMSESARHYGGVSAQERKAARRERLLDAGLQLFGTPGGDRVTVSAVCAEAGLTERYFY